MSYSYLAKSLKMHDCQVRQKKNKSCYDIAMVTSYIAITMISVEWSKDFFGPHLKNFLDTLGACSGLLLHQPTICDKHLLEYASSTLLASQLPPMPTMSMVPGTQDIYHKFYQLCYNLRNEASDNLRIKE